MEPVNTLQQSFIGRRKPPSKLDESFDIENEDATLRPVCDLCSTASKITQSVCKDCEEFMCADCETAHRGSRATKTHQVVEIVDLLKTHQLSLENCLECVDATKQEVGRKHMHNTELMNSIKESEVREIEKVNQIREKIKAQVDLHHDEIIAEVKRLHSNEQVTLAQTEAAIQKANADISETVKVLSNAMKSQDILLSFETVRDIRHEVSHKVNTIQSNLPDSKQNVKIPMTIEEGEGWNPLKSTWIKMTNGKQKQSERNVYWSPPVAELETPGSSCKSGSLFNETLMSDGASLEMQPISTEHVKSNQDTGCTLINGAASVDDMSPYNLMEDTEETDGPPPGLPLQKNEDKKCPVCDMVFDLEVSSEDMFMEHIQLHFTQTKDCPMCGKSFSSDTDNTVYEEHVTKHFNDDCAEPQAEFEELEFIK